MKSKKMVFLALLVALMASCVSTQQKGAGEYQIAGQMVYGHTFSNTGEVVLYPTPSDMDVGIEGIVIGSINKGVLNLTLPPLLPGIQQLEGGGEWVYTRLQLVDAFLALVNSETESFVYFKYKLTVDDSGTTKGWVFVDSKTGREDTLEHYYERGYKWFGGQEMPW